MPASRTPPVQIINLPTNHVKLTERETEVLACIAEGKNNREIADALFISEGRVANCISEILYKLDCQNRTCAVLKALVLHYLELY
jgi:two-component system response regulator DegU